jgi:hypothetical protein
MQQFACKVIQCCYHLFACFTICRGRGQVVAAACAAETVVLATSKGFLLRYQWDEYGNEKGGLQKSAEQC